MDHITRALERARGRGEEPREAAPEFIVPRSRRPEPGAADEFAGESRRPPSADRAGYRGGAAAAGTTIYELDSGQADSEKILPAGATGPHSAPYKMLRTQVMKRLKQLEVNSLAVMSPTSGIGKTLTAINLAIAIAADRGRSVLLVDFDFRNPSIALRLGLEPRVGIDDCLQKGRPLQDAMVKLAGYERLTVLPARAAVENSSELLAEQATADVVTEMRRLFAQGVVIFDLPPVLQADDTLAFAPCAQAGLLVVAEGRTRREDVTRSIGLLRDMTIIGTLLNGSRESAQTPY